MIGRRQPLGTCTRAPAPSRGGEPAASVLVQPPTPMRIAHLEGRGRGLVATRAISRGEVLLQERPLVTVGADRLATAWTKLGTEAAALDAEWEISGQQFPRLCLRIVGLLLSRPGLWNEQLRHLCFPTMDSRSLPEQWVTDYHRLRQSLLAPGGGSSTGDGSATGGAVLAPGVVEQFDMMFAPAVWGTLMGMAHLNSFRLHCPSLTNPAAEATCLFVQASFFNHDCNPNVEVQSPDVSTVVDEQPSFQFVAATEVLEGQELCISYVGETAREPGRRKQQLELLCWGYGVNVDC